MSKRGRPSSRPEAGDPGKSHRVIGVLGTSPAVVSEFLWWLSSVSGTRVDKVEVWTTEQGKAAAKRLFEEGGFWEQLVLQSGREGAGPLLPDLGKLEYRLFGSPGRWLDDIRREEDAKLVLQALCDRVREIHEADPGRVALHALISGGRKTMGAALQTAVQLFGECDDRLYHVLVHPAIEADRDLIRSFGFPRGPLKVTGRDGRPAVLTVAEQVVVSQQPVPLLRSLVPPEAFRAVVDELVQTCLFGKRA